MKMEFTKEQIEELKEVSKKLGKKEFIMDLTDFIEKKLSEE